MDAPSLGVVIVTFNAGEEIAGCLESLAAAGLSDLRVVVVDNASTDGTPARIRAWADGTRPYAPDLALPFALAPVAKPVTLVEGAADHPPAPPGAVTLLHGGANRGFAGGVNLGLAHLRACPEIAHVWVLNPDSLVPPETLPALRARLARGERYALMGGRVVYLEKPDRIQGDGGWINPRTGVTGNLNLGCNAARTPPPDPARMDFIGGASMVASRAFLERAGPMVEDYFLYYEEVDWALRRGDLPLAYCAGLVVYHRSGTAIGSAAWGRRASAFSTYFKHRARMRFMRRFHPAWLPMAMGYSLAQAARHLWRRDPPAAWAVLTAVFALPAPAEVRDRIAPEARVHAFAPRQPTPPLPAPPV